MIPDRPSRSVLWGYEVSLTYENGLNTRVADNLGRELTFSYDTRGLVTAMTTPDGQVYHYDYVPTFPTTSSLVDMSKVQTTWKRNYVLSKVTNPDGTVLTYAYGNKAFPYALTSVTDERGIVVATWSYDAQGRVSDNRQAADVGHVTLSYDTTNNRTTVVNPLGRSTIYSYDRNVSGTSVLTAVDGQATINCASDNTQMTYVKDKDLHTTFLDRTIDAEGRVTKTTHDAAGYVTSITRGFGTSDAVTTSYSWHPTLHVPVRKTEPGLTTDYTWDSDGHPTQVTQTDTTTLTQPYSTSGQTRTWTYTYGDGGLLTSVDGPLTGSGDRILYIYTSQGFLASVTDEAGQTTTVTSWTGRGQPSSVTDPNGVVTTYAYDARGRLIAMTVDANGTPAHYGTSYDASGDVTRIDLPNGGSWRFTYDAARRLTGVTNPAGDTLTLSLDAMGHATSLTASNAAGVAGFVKKQVFDEIGRLMRQAGAQPASSTWQVGYDRTDNPTQLTDPAANQSTYGFDSLARLVRQTDALGSKTQLTLNGQDQTSAITDPRGLTTQLVRNGFGEVIQEVSPDRGTITYERDARGLVTKRTDARGMVTNYIYDNAGRLVVRSYPGSAGSIVHLYYDNKRDGNHGAGHLTALSDESGTSTTTHDAQGRISVQARVFAGLAKPFTMQYRRDISGDVTDMVYPSGRTLHMTRDLAGRITTLSTFAVGAVSGRMLASQVTYAPFGTVESLLFSNGITERFTRDTDGRVTRTTLQAAGAAAGSFLADRQLSWIGDELRSVRDAVTSSQSQSFTYANGRMASATGSYGTLAWTYDANGNRLSEKLNDVQATYAYPTSSNRLQGLSSPSYQRILGYDASGNVTTDARAGLQGQIFTYDAENRLNSALQLSNPPVVTRYRYDARHRLATRVLGTTTTTKSVGTTYYLHDIDDHIIAEIDEKGIVQREYVWLEDMPVAVIDAPESSAASIALVNTDHLNRPVRLTNLSGATTWQAFYKPFGEVQSVSSPAVVQNLRFPAQYFQIENGLAYNWHRHYDASLGRFLQPDRLGTDALLRDGGSLYSYARGNPLGLVDERGELVWAPILIGAGLGAGFDLASQLYGNGGNLRCVHLGQLLGSAGIGALGGAAGSLGSSRLGWEFSHWLPGRYIRPLSISGKNSNPYYKSWLDLPGIRDFINSEANGNYVTPWFHAKSDPFRMLKGMTAGDKWPGFIQQIARAPGWLSGSVSGSLLGSAFGGSSEECGCQ